MRKLTTFLAITLMSLAAVSLSACNGGEEDPGTVTPPPPEDKLTVAPQSLAFEAEEADPQTIDVTSTAAWTATPDADWIKITPAEGTGNGTISVTVDPATEERSGSIRIESGELSQTVTVGQSAPEITIEAPAAAGPISGPDLIDEGETIELEVAAIQRAETYVWYKDDEVVQNTSSRTLAVTAPGEYKVAGENSAGKGAPSPVYTVVLRILPAAAGTITVVDNGAAFQSYILSCDPIEGATSYRWYYWPLDSDEKLSVDDARNNEVLLVAYDYPGYYSVAGFNEFGEGRESDRAFVPKYETPSLPPLEVNQFAWGDEVFPIHPTSMDFWYDSIIEMNMFDGTKDENGTFNHMFKLTWPVWGLDGQTLDLSTYGYFEYYSSKRAWLGYPREKEWCEIIGGTGWMRYDDATLQLDYEVDFEVEGEWGPTHFRAKFSGKVVKS